MSCHSCNELCKIDVRFHEIQKYEGAWEGWSATKDEMREYLINKIREYSNLISILEDKYNEDDN